MVEIEKRIIQATGPQSKSVRFGCLDKVGNRTGGKRLVGTRGTRLEITDVMLSLDAVKPANK
ncbi:hypothetical protein GCM10027347_53580 [Larkinella harenae]